MDFVTGINKKSNPAPCMTGPGVQRAQKMSATMSRREILDLAVRDSAIIEEALSSEQPLKELMRASCLTAAYTENLKVEREARPWARNPQSQVCGSTLSCDVHAVFKHNLLSSHFTLHRTGCCMQEYAAALQRFSRCIYKYSKARKDDPELAKVSSTIVPWSTPCCLRRRTIRERCCVRSTV